MCKTTPSPGPGPHSHFPPPVLGAKAGEQLHAEGNGNNRTGGPRQPRKGQTPHEGAQPDAARVLGAQETGVPRSPSWPAPDREDS